MGSAVAGGRNTTTINSAALPGTGTRLGACDPDPDAEADPGYGKTTGGEMNGLKVVGAATSLIAAVAMAACGGSSATEVQQPVMTASTSTSTHGAAAPLTVAKQLKVPDGHRLVSSMEASGVQVYKCADGTWKLLEPAATLAVDGKTTALHSRGQVWVSTADGSAVTAKPVPGASAPRPKAVPELLLKATTTRGTGVFGRVSYVQRLGTEGGVAPSQPCTGEQQKAVPYTATYMFYAPT
jgi:hypothetical protein